MTARFLPVKYALDHWHASSRGIIFIVFLLRSFFIFFFHPLEAVHKICVRMCVCMCVLNMQIIIFSLLTQKVHEMQTEHDADSRFSPISLPPSPSLSMGNV